MTRAEKVAQLGSFWAFEVVPESGFDAARLAALAGDGIGQITRLAGSTNLRPVEVAADRQRDPALPRRGDAARDPGHHPRGMPARPHRLGAPCFQQSIGAAASFDPERRHRDGRDDPPADAADRRPARARAGPRHRAATRAGAGSRRPTARTRTSPPSSAAPTSRRSRVPTSRDGVIATGQAHGRPRAGRRRAEPGAGAHRPARAARRAAVPVRGGRPAGPGSPASCPPTATWTACRATPRRSCSTGILRGEWGFDGIVASDYIGVEMIATAHQLTADLGEAARLALVAGVDCRAAADRRLRRSRSRPPSRTAGSTTTTLDAAVARVLRMKFRLGLFDRPYVAVRDEADLRRAGRRRGPSPPARSPSARWSWSRTTGSCRSTGARQRVAVIGPIADSARDLLGDYSHLVHMETLREMHDGRRRAGHRRRWRRHRAGRRAGRAADDPRRASAASLAGAEVVHARGTGISDGTDAEMAEAVAARARVRRRDPRARRALRPDRRLDDRRVPRPLDARASMGRQQELLDAVVATGTPVVLVVVSGRPLSHRMGGRALPRGPPRVGARRRRSGRDRRRADRGREPGRQAAGLDPAPRRPGAADVPAPPDRRPLAAEGRLRRRAGRAPVAVRASACRTRRSGSTGCASIATELATDGGEVTISVDVTNTGQRAGDEVVQLYVRDDEATVARPVRELRGFRRVSLEPGECRTVSFTTLGRAVRLHRRRPPARRRARHHRSPRRDLVGRPAGVDATVPPGRADHRAARPTPLPDRERPCLTTRRK